MKVGIKRSAGTSCHKILLERLETTEHIRQIFVSYHVFQLYITDNNLPVTYVDSFIVSSMIIPFGNAAKIVIDDMDMFTLWLYHRELLCNS